MTPIEFRAQLKALGLTAARFAALTGVRSETVSRWGNTLPDAPAWVPLLLTAWSATGVPGCAPAPASLAPKAVLQGSNQPAPAKPPKPRKPKINTAAIMAAADRVTASFDALKRAPLRQPSAPTCTKCGFLMRAGRCTNRGCK